MTSSRVGKTFHFKKSNLVEAPCEYVDDMTIMGYSLCKIVVKLSVSVAELHSQYWELTFNAFL